MEAAILQDWITTRGTELTTSVVQSAESWADLGACEDLVFFLDVREVTSGVQMFYETAPAKEQGAFLPMARVAALATGVRVDRVFSTNGGVPPARYVRWRLQATSGPTWDVTFRIWIATYAWRRSVR